MAAVASAVIPSSSLAAPARGDASGFGALLDGGTAASARAASDTHPSRSAVAQALTGAAGSVGRADVTLRTGSEGTSGFAEGTATARDVNLFGGRVVAATVRLSVRARAGAGGGEAGVTAYSITGLLVDGRPVSTSPGTRVEMTGLGTLTLVEQVADATGSVRANAMRLEVTDASTGVAPGTQIVVGHLEAVAAPGDAPVPAPAPEPPAAPREGLTPSPARPPLPRPTLPRVRARELPPVVGIPRLASPPAPLLPRRIAPAGAAGIGPDGYTFPVLGQYSFVDTYGAPRADTGWHHGIDIFAQEGTPLVAVADGTLFNVGVNTLGGNRLWVRDERGNTFYYAHLSAYAPSAVEGAHVRAGEVIGFMGHTGDAVGTPTHLHFEVHPGDGDSVNPYPYLLAWQRGSQVSLAFRAAEVATGQAPAAGALLVAFTPVSETPAPDPDGRAETVP